MSRRGTSEVLSLSSMVTGLLRGKYESPLATQPLGAAAIDTMKNAGLMAAIVQNADICALSCGVLPSMPVRIMNDENSRYPIAQYTSESARRPSGLA